MWHTEPFCLRLRTIVGDHGMDVEQLAVSANIHPDDVHRWLEGVSFPSEAEVARMAQALEVHEAKLLDATDHPLDRPY